MSAFKYTWVDHLVCMKTAKRQFELNTEDVHSFDSSSYRAGQVARMVPAKKKRKKLQEEFNEPANTDLASSIVFASETMGSLQFCIDYCKLSAVTVKDSYPLSRLRSTSILLEHLKSSPHYMSTTHCGRFWLANETDEEGRSRVNTDSFNSCECILAWKHTGRFHRPM